MRISELLISIASWLESPNNEALLLADDNEECSKIIAENCILAAEILKNAAEQVNEIEPQEDSAITPESLDELAAIAQEFDASGDEFLKKRASVIDELLLTIASPPNAYAARKDLEDNRIIELQKKYQQPREELYKSNGIEKSEKAIDKSDMAKKYNILEAPLSSRYCPDHAGVQIARVGEHMWQCEMDKKIYNFETGFELNNGSKVPGGDVAEQTTGLERPSHAIFDSRDGRLNQNK